MGICIRRDGWPLEFFAIWKPWNTHLETACLWTRGQAIWQSGNGIGPNWVPKTIGFNIKMISWGYPQETHTVYIYIYIWFLLLFASLPPRMISPSVWVIFDPYPCMGTMSCVVSSWFLGYQKPSVLLDAFDAQSDYVSACLSHLLAKIPMLIFPINGLSHLYNSNSMPMNDYRYPIVYSKYDIHIYKYMYILWNIS